MSHKIRIIFTHIQLTAIVTALLFFQPVVPACGEQVSETLESGRIITLDFEQNSNGVINFKKISRPKIALALSGGGLRGLAQIGVIDEFEKAGVPIDYIAASSMGSIVGGLYASGYTPKELEQIALDTDWTSIFFDNPERSTMFISQKEELNRHLLEIRFEGRKPYIPQAVSQGQQISTLLNSLILRASFQPYNDFNDFRIPLRIVSTNMLTGKEEVFDRGDIARVILASISVPLLFSPVKIDSSYYWDAGLLNNIPVNVARDMGGDIVVAVNTTAPLRVLSQMQYPHEHFDQGITIMQQSRNLEALKKADFVIAPRLGNISAYQSDAVPDFIRYGRIAAVEKIPEILAKLKDGHDSPGNPDIYIPSSIEVEGANNRPENFIRSFIHINTYRVTNDNQVKEDLERIYESGYFSSVRALVKSRNDSIIVVYKVKENQSVNNIEITGNTIFTKEQLLENYANKSSKTVNMNDASMFIQNVHDIYVDKGYSLARVSEFRLDTLSGSLNIRIDEGVIDEIVIRGINKTRPHVVLRELPLIKGDIFNVNLAQRGIANIYGTGLFQRVFPSFIKNNGKLQLQINLEEKKYEVIRAGARYDLEKEGIGFIELSDDNFLGLGMKSKTHFRYGPREEKYSYNLRTDRIFISYLSFTTDTHYETKTGFLTLPESNFKDQGDYKTTRIGSRLSFGRQLGRFGTVSAELNIEKVKVEAFPGQSISDETAGVFYNRINEQLDLRTFTLRSVVDTRDKYPFPTKGNFHEIYYETSGKILSGDLSYIKFYTSLGYIFTLQENHTLETRTLFGFADDTMPFAQRFRWGGLHKFFGKKLDSMHGRMLAAGNFEYRHKFQIQNFFNTYFSLRYDIVNIAEKNQKVQFKNFKHAIGGIISVELPFGPIEIGYGSAINESERIYFSIGHHF